MDFVDFKLFYKLISGKTNREEITNRVVCSRKTLSIRFKIFFDHPLTPRRVWEILPPCFSSPWVYGVDGKWLRRNGVFLIHRNITTGENLYWSFAGSESYLALYTDLEAMVNLPGFRLPLGAVSDWKGAILSAVRSYLGDIPHQRCLTHVERTNKTLLPKHSPFPATLALREIVLRLINIEGEEGKQIWQDDLDRWYLEYGFLLTRRTINSDPGVKHKWWYTHGNLRRAWGLLTKDQDPFFVHLKQSLIPKSNNSLEGTISQATKRLGCHRGMKFSQQAAFLSWYFTFSRVKTRADLIRLWGVWKRTKN